MNQAINNFIEFQKPYFLYVNYAEIEIASNHLAIIKANKGTNLDLQLMWQMHHVILHALRDDYGVVIDHEQDFSMNPVEVYQFLNQWPPLRAIASICQRGKSATIAQIELQLSSKPIEIFTAIDEAKQWIESIII